MRKTKKEILEGVPSEAIISSKKIGNNTYEVLLTNGDRIIRLHNTNVITYKPDNTVILDSGGWLTPTTKDRINQYSPYKISQRKNIWFITVADQEYIFEDRMQIKGDVVTGANVNNEKELTLLNKKINSYVKNYIEKLITRNMDRPSEADCWYCALSNKDSSLGELTHDKNHIISHIEESYYVPSLLIRAIEKLPISQVGMHCLGYWFKYHEDQCQNMEDIAISQIKKSLTRYIRSQVELSR